MKIQGKALKYEKNADDINTDVIWPGKYTYVQIPPEEMHKYAMETYDPEFKDRIKGRSILVVGKNFGCGSSREQASECLLHSGVKVIIAKSFSRIFYRNSINLGLVVIESVEAVDAINDGESVCVDLEKGEIEIFCDEGREENKKIKISCYPPFVRELIEDGGLINNIKKRVERGELS